MMGVVIAGQISKNKVDVDLNFHKSAQHLETKTDMYAREVDYYV